MSEWGCADCGVDTNEIHEYYMVTDLVWQLYAEDVDAGLLCIGCLEDRMGRELDAGDFSDCLLNELDMGWRKSDRLIERLTTQV